MQISFQIKTNPHLISFFFCYSSLLKYFKEKFTISQNIDNHNVFCSK